MLIGLWRIIMVRNEFFNWLKEHNNKCSIKQLRDIGLKEKKINDTTYWVDDDEKTIVISFVDTDDIDTEFIVKIADPIVPIQQPKTEYVVKNMQPWLDNQHYESSVSIRDLNKKFYDKFYERKGRKYFHNH